MRWVNKQFKMADAQAPVSDDGISWTKSLAFELKRLSKDFVFEMLGAHFSTPHYSEVFVCISFDPF